ncbi:MAG: sodium:solute symporter family protein, partial [Clostridia bacterium]|nr:sodium:solute symporter family protein [Clostridia bacterium]
MSSNTIFLILFVIFCGILVAAGLISKRWVKESTDYILAGREISTFINMIGVCAIGFAGTTIALAPGFTIQFGLTASFAWGLIYAVCGLILFALLFGNFIRRCGAQTLPEFLEMRYDGKVRSVVAITSVIGMSGILANNIVSCTNAIVGFTKWSAPVVMAIIFLVIIAFTFISGLWATTITDFFQVTMGVVIVPAVLFSLIGKFGGFDILNATWPGEIFEVGLSGASMNSVALTYPSILNFVICFAAALVWGNNYYWMKIANCRSEKVAKKSFVLAGIILVVIFCIPLSLIGGYTGAFHGEVFTAPFGQGSVPPTGAYGFVASLFPPLLGSLFVIGAVAASVSTSSTAALGASAVATRDIYQRLVNPKADTKQSLK